MTLPTTPTTTTTGASSSKVKDVLFKASCVAMVFIGMPVAVLLAHGDDDFVSWDTFEATYDVQRPAYPTGDWVRTGQSITVTGHVNGVKANCVATVPDTRPVVTCDGVEADRR